MLGTCDEVSELLMGVNGGVLQADLDGPDMLECAPPFSNACCS